MKSFHDEFSPYAQAVAKALLGQPNASLSKSTELRFGNRGSMAVDLGKGTWFDNERGAGGGVLDLIVYRGEAGTKAEAVRWMEREGIKLPDAAKQQERLVKTYPYLDEYGQVLFEVCRFEPKAFKQRRPNAGARGGWTWSVKDVRQVPYRLPHLLATPDAVVFVVEGEKDADALATLGLVATCNAGGAGKWPDTITKCLMGRRVCILPDNDEPGHAHAAKVATKLRGVAADVRVLELPGLPLKGDVCDWLASGGNAEKLLQLTKSAPLPQIAAEGELIAPERIAPPENSDDALALEFVQRAADVRWSHGLGWMIDNGVTWTRDDNMQRYDLARRVCRVAASRTDDKGEAKRLASARTVNATLSLAQTDPAIVVPPAVWDSDKMALNTPAGIVDLKTGALRTRGVEFVTQAARVAPDFNGPCPTWHRFMRQVFVDDVELIEFMQRSMGYWLSGDRREQVIHFLYGLGANGKSVLTEFVQWLGGSYTLKLPASALMQSKGERHPTELAQLRGKRLAVSSELDENSFFNESLIKELTGDNTLTARFMRADFFEFEMQQKHVIVGNFKPRLRGGDPAIARRMLLVPFNARFHGLDRDPHMLDKLKAEAPAILAWIIEGAVKWHRGGLAIPNSVRDASADYMADHDDMQLWVDACCEMQGECKASHLYTSFGNWKKARGEHAPSQTVWGSRLTTLAGVSKRRSGGIRYSGIQLTHDEMRRVNPWTA
ncbi:phage/plasmid primase, P4 family [Variovorax sp. J22R133]|uniref:phage/plasmid primase, P4 family n=1 Tax=Variovorax brevis TaxID=3053503 RepID=UPI002574C725|nr:phage/plasmid primase, P4 family [Variovorax sp. J22R133]MDM0113513.1 phage/plasmid primase, P4 family [Variovorax sp. J22R133]